MYYVYWEMGSGANMYLAVMITLLTIMGPEKGKKTSWKLIQRFEILINFFIHSILFLQVELHSWSSLVFSHHQLEEEDFYACSLWKLFRYGSTWSDRKITRCMNTRKISYMLSIKTSIITLEFLMIREAFPHWYSKTDFFSRLSFTTILPLTFW